MNNNKFGKCIKSVEIKHHTQNIQQVKINCRKIIKVLWNKLQLKHTMKKEWDATDQI